MRYFIDTEFYEDATRIHPISIGIVAQDGRELYVELLGFNWGIVPKGHWIQDNVRPHLLRKRGQHQDSYAIEGDTTYGLLVQKRASAAIIDFVGEDTAPEFYGYFADYDWVLLSQLFGTMMQLPEHFPKWCRDLKQMAWERGRDGSWIKEHVPQPAAAHNALEDARWCQELYRKLTQHLEPRFLRAEGGLHGIYKAYDIPLDGIDVMGAALQLFLATPESPIENDTSRAYRATAQRMLDVLYKATRSPTVASAAPPATPPLPGWVHLPDVDDTDDLPY